MAPNVNLGIILIAYPLPHSSPSHTASSNEDSFLSDILEVATTQMASNRGMPIPTIQIKHLGAAHTEL